MKRVKLLTAARRVGTDQRQFVLLGVCGIALAVKLVDMFVAWHARRTAQRLREMVEREYHAMIRR